MPPQPSQSWTDFLSCPCCNHEFDGITYIPVSLDCCHTICRPCLIRLHQDSKNCPFDSGIPITVEILTYPANTALLAISGYKLSQTEIAKSLQEHFLLETDRATVRKCMLLLEHFAEYLQQGMQALGANQLSTNCSSSASLNSAGILTLSRPLQKKLVTMISCQLVSPAGRGRLVRSVRAVGERCITELILQHQHPHQLSGNLWGAVRSRGCQFLGPAMQEEVIRLILLALEDGSALSRKVLVLFVVQRLSGKYPQASKTAIGHVVQLLYRASCFKVSKRDGESSLMQLKEDYCSYEALRREHDTQIVQIANEAGLRIAPDQWSSLLYGDTVHKPMMQSIIDRLQTPQSFSQSVSELMIALKRTNDPSSVARLEEPLNAIASIAESEKQSLTDVLSGLQAVQVVLDALVDFVKSASNRKLNFAQVAHPKYKTSLCRDLVSRGACPRGPNCTFAHSDDELDRFRRGTENEPTEQLNGANFSELNYLESPDLFRRQLLTDASSGVSKPNRVYEQPSQRPLAFPSEFPSATQSQRVSSRPVAANVQPVFLADESQYSQAFLSTSLQSGYYYPEQRSHPRMHADHRAHSLMMPAPDQRVHCPILQVGSAHQVTPYERPLGTPQGYYAPRPPLPIAHSHQIQPAPVIPSALRQPFHGSGALHPAHGYLPHAGGDIYMKSSPGTPAYGGYYPLVTHEYPPHSYYMPGRDDLYCRNGYNFQSVPEYMGEEWQPVADCNPVFTDSGPLYEYQTSNASSTNDQNTVHETLASLLRRREELLDKLQSVNQMLPANNLKTEVSIGRMVDLARSVAANLDAGTSQSDLQASILQNMLNSATPSISPGDETNHEESISARPAPSSSLASTNLSADDAEFSLLGTTKGGLGVAISTTNDSRAFAGSIKKSLSSLSGGPKNSPSLSLTSSWTSISTSGNGLRTSGHSLASSTLTTHSTMACLTSSSATTTGFQGSLVDQSDQVAEHIIHVPSAGFDQDQVSYEQNLVHSRATDDEKLKIPIGYRRAYSENLDPSTVASGSSEQETTTPTTWSSAAPRGHRSYANWMLFDRSFSSGDAQADSPEIIPWSDRQVISKFGPISRSRLAQPLSSNVKQLKANHATHEVTVTPVHLPMAVLSSAKESSSRQNTSAHSQRPGNAANLAIPCTTDVPKTQATTQQKDAANEFSFTITSSCVSGVASSVTESEQLKQELKIVNSKIDKYETQAACDELAKVEMSIRQLNLPAASPAAIHQSQVFTA